VHTFLEGSRHTERAILTGAGMSTLNFEFEAEDGNDKGDIIAATVRERYTRIIQESVQQDISKLLLSSRAYLNHERGHSTSNVVATKALSRPKDCMMHRENKFCQDQKLEDHMDYARVKTIQLREQRFKKEADEAEDEAKRQQKIRSIQAYREKKIQVSVE
jgi:hypothetical protein